MRPSHPPAPPRSDPKQRRRETGVRFERPTRARVQRITVGTLTLLAGVGLGWLAAGATSDDRFREMQNIAEALMEEETGSVWPPRQEAPSPDAGAPVSPDLGPLRHDDAGPPLPTPPPARPDFQVRQQNMSGLYFLEAVIGGADFDDALPMVVVLHGRGDRAHVPGGPFMDLAHSVRVVVPQAPDPLGDGWQWLPVRVGDGLVDRLSSTLFERADYLARFIKELMEARPTQGRAIVTGFSQGGLLTLTLAVHHDDVVGYAIPLAAWLPPPLEPSYLRSDRRFAPIRAMHGTADPIIPIDPTTSLFGRLSDIGFDVDLVQVPGVEHTMSHDMNELFHEWLDEAVCVMVEDSDCAVLARWKAAALRDVPLPALDAGPPRLPDGAPIPLDGAVRRDGAPRVRRPAATASDLGPPSSAEPTAPSGPSPD